MKYANEIGLKSNRLVTLMSLYIRNEERSEICVVRLGHDASCFCGNMRLVLN